MSHVFVSYSRKDSETVDHIVARLDEDKFDTWIDREEIHGGDLWREEIVEAIDNAYAFVLMLSPDSVASDNVRKEVDLSEQAGKALVPLLLAPTQLPSAFRYPLAGSNGLNIFVIRTGNLVKSSKCCASMRKNPERSNLSKHAR